MPGVPDGEGAMEVHRQVDVHRSRYPLPLPRSRSSCPYCQRGGVYSGEGASGEGASNQGERRVQGLDSEFNLGNAAEVWPPVLPATREAPAVELGAGAAGLQKATPRHLWPRPGGEAPAAEWGAGAAGVRKATPQHHRPPPGEEAPAAEL